MTMKKEKQDCLDALQEKLDLLKSCLELVQAKTGLLMRHDLTGLEALLVREAEMMEQLNEAQWQPGEAEIRHGEGLSAEWISLKAEISAVAKEIQLTNHTNARLIQNGQQFCEVLYGAVCPPQTYSPSLSVVSRPVEATFQAQY